MVILEGCADTKAAGHLLNLKNVFPSAALYRQGSSLKIHIQEVRRPKYERSDDPFVIEIFEVLLIASHKNVCLVINSSREDNLVILGKFSYLFAFEVSGNVSQYLRLVDQLVEKLLRFGSFLSDIEKGLLAYQIGDVHLEHAKLLNLIE